MTLDTTQWQEILGASLGSLTLNGLLASLLLGLVCLIVIRIVNALVGRMLAASKLEERVKGYIAAGVKALLYALAVLIVADSLGIPVTSLIALVSVLGLAISLAVQDVLANVAGGLVILFSRPFAPGDYIATDDGEGDVTEIGLTHTRLDTFSGQRVMLPNSKLVAGKIVNYTTRGVRRVSHTVSVSWDCSAPQVRKACLQAVERTPGVLAEPAPAVVVTGYGEGTVLYSVRFWTAVGDYWSAHDASLEQLRLCLQEQGIPLAYSRMQVHIVEKNTEE